MGRGQSVIWCEDRHAREGRHVEHRRCGVMHAGERYGFSLLKGNHVRSDGDVAIVVFDQIMSGV